MSRRSKKSREVDLFNFSFLDILACVIGLLIFILSIVTISGGQTSAGRATASVADADHRIQQAEAAADLAARRRQQAENLLTTLSRRLADPKAANDSLRAQINVMDQETVSLNLGAASAAARIQTIHKSLAGLRPATGPAAADMQKQIDEVDQDTAALQAQADQQRQRALANRQKVEFYVPHLHEVHQHTAWVEVSRDRLWCLDSDDYQQEAVAVNSTAYTRRQTAPGTLVASITHGKAQLPPALANVRPDDTVLDVALRPDGYAAFRELRQWAWSKGFSVNWDYTDEPAIVLTRSHSIFAQ